VSAGALRAAWVAKAAMGHNALRRAWSHSSLRVAGMASFALGLALSTFALFHRAFAFLDGIDVLGPVLLVRLLSLFFFMLFVMLVMSNVLVSFQTLYRSREADFWALAPLPPERVFDARSLEIGLISSWAFLVLGAPLLLAYGLGTGARAGFYLLLPPVLALFAAIAHWLGALFTIALVRAFPGLDLKRLIAVIAVALTPVAVALTRAFRIQSVGPGSDGTELLVHALEGLGRTQYPLLPGYWSAEALRAAALGDLGRAAFLTWTLAVTAALTLLLARAAAGRWLIEGFQLLRGVALSRPVGRRTRRRSSRPSGGPLRALARKDAALFFREPAQWSQVALVSVLAAVYVANLRNLPDLGRFSLWGQVAAYLNLGVALLLVATLTTRFAFPLVSMEGRRAWIVLLAPIRRTALVGQKLLVALPVALVFGFAAVVLSTRVLGVPAEAARASLLLAPAGAYALSGLAVGLGASFPNFKEDNPARIVSGFGGTLNFLAGMTYCGLVTLLLGAPSVLEALERWDADRRAAWQPLALAAALTLSALVGTVPLVLGRRHLARLEL
jgi:ABC-2 type transport system permease protein